MAYITVTTPAPIFTELTTLTASTIAPSTISAPTGLCTLPEFTPCSTLGVWACCDTLRTMAACPSGYASCNQHSRFHDRDGCCPSDEECQFSGVPSYSSGNNLIIPITPSAIIIPRTAQEDAILPIGDPSEMSKEVYAPIEALTSKPSLDEPSATISNPPIFASQIPFLPLSTFKTSTTTDPLDTPLNTPIMAPSFQTSIPTPTHPILSTGSPHPQDSSASEPLTIAMQAGIGIGLFLLLVGIMAALYLLYRRRRSLRGETDTARGYAEMQGVDSRLSRTVTATTSIEAVEMAGCVPVTTEERIAGRGNVVVALKELEDLVVARRGREVELSAEKASPTKSWLDI